MNITSTQDIEIKEHFNLNIFIEHNPIGTIEQCE